MEAVVPCGRRGIAPVAIQKLAAALRSQRGLEVAQLEVEMIER